MTRKIAIIKTDTHYHDEYGDSYSKIVDSITDWQEVTDEQFKMLVAAQNRFNFKIIEQPADTPAFIAKTISAYLKMVEELKVKEAEEKKKREEACLARKLKKDLRDKKSKLELFNKLKAELEGKA